MENICKDCVNYFDTHAALNLLQRIFSIKTMFSEVCKHKQFADCVDGSPMACITARINKCDGKPPFFQPKNKK